MEQNKKIKVEKVENKKGKTEITTSKIKGNNKSTVTTYRFPSSYIFYRIKYFNSKKT